MGEIIFTWQFICKNFAFRCNKAEKSSFYRSQWTKNRIFFLLYRIFMSLYPLVWLIVWFVQQRGADSYHFLTIWGEHIVVIYFALALALSAVGVSRRKNLDKKEPVAIKILRSATWMFFNVSSVVEIIITVVYWSLLAPTNPPDQLLVSFNIHQHLILLILLLIDIFMTAFPIRLLHVIYAMAYGVIYITMTLLLHATDTDHAVYNFLDWQTNPGLAAGMSVGMIIIGTAVAQCIIFGLYCLRLQVHKRCAKRSRVVSPIPDEATLSTINGNRFKLATDNPAYDRVTDIP